VVIETYREMVRYFGEKDPTTRMMPERILAQEEEHANDMHDLLVQHEGRPILKKQGFRRRFAAVGLGRPQAARAPNMLT
jgi:bacterioferritin (cytochrome b1)